MLGGIKVAKRQIRNTTTAVERDKDVVGLEVAVEQLARVQHREASHNVHGETSDLVGTKELLLRLTASDLLMQGAMVESHKDLDRARQSAMEQVAHKVLVIW